MPAAAATSRNDPVAGPISRRPPYNRAIPRRAGGGDRHMDRGYDSTGGRGGDEAGPLALLRSRDLIALARKGDDRARETLYERYRPALKRWASGRLPLWARDLVDTDD